MDLHLAIRLFVVAIVLVYVLAPMVRLLNLTNYLYQIQQR